MADSSRDCCQPGITPTLMKAFKSQRHAFGYLYPCPVEIGCRDNFAFFDLRSFKVDYLPWIFVVTVISGVVTLGSVCLMLVSLLYSGQDALPPWVKYSPFQAMIIAIIGLAIVLELVTYFGVFVTPEMVTAFTGIQLIESQCIRSLKATYPRSNEDHKSGSKTTRSQSGGVKKMNLIDIGMCSLILIGSLLPLPTAMMSVLVDIDVFYYIGEKYFLPEIYERELSITVCWMLVRLAICFFNLVEMGRALTLFIVSLVAYVLVTMSIVGKLPFCNKKCHFFYTQLRIHFVILENYMNFMTGILLCFGYTIQMVAAWIVIKCYGDMPLFLYLVFAIALVMSIVTTVILISVGSKLQEQTELLVKQRKMFYFSVDTVKKSRFIQCKIWKATKSLHYRCMWFFDIHSDFFMVFWDHFINDLVTVLLLF